MRKDVTGTELVIGGMQSDDRVSGVTHSMHTVWKASIWTSQLAMRF